MAIFDRTQILKTSPEFAEAIGQLMRVEQACEGLDVPQIVSQVAEVGLPVSPHLLIISRETAQALASHAVTPELAQNLLDPHTNGFYDPMLDIAFVIRDPELERRNGIWITYYFIAEELIHASSIGNQLLHISDDQNVSPIFKGIAAHPTNTNQFLEEGFANYLAAGLASRWNDMHSPFRSRVAMNLDLPVNIWLNGQPTSIPAKFLHLNAHGQVAMFSGSLSGVIFGKLVELDHEIFNLVVVSRCQPERILDLWGEILQVQKELVSQIPYLDLDNVELLQSLLRILSK